MRPHDIVVLLKIATKGDSLWYMKDIAYELGISQSEVSESLNRSVYGGLIAGDKKILLRNAMLEFIEHGIRYVFPQKPGTLTRGMLTAHSAPPLSGLIASKTKYVWPWANGKDRGLAIEPLHPSVPEACSKDSLLHKMLGLTDTMRVGKAREKRLAIEELSTML